MSWLSQLLKPSQREKDIHLRYLDFDHPDLAAQVVAGALNPEEFQEVTLPKLFHEILHIVPRENEPCYVAWLRTMALENDLPNLWPIHEELEAAIMGSPICQRFLKIIVF